VRILFEDEKSKKEKESVKEIKLKEEKKHDY
jgi:hypothetical protein